MANISVVTVVQAGIAPPTLTAAAGGGDAFVNDGRTYFHVANGGGSPINVTIDSQAPCNQGQSHDVVVAVPAGEARLIGKFNQHRYNDSTGKVQVTYSAVTSVTVGAVSIP